MEIWQFNDPEPLRPFIGVLDVHAPHLVDSARRLFNCNGAKARVHLSHLAQGLIDNSKTVREAVRILIFSPPVEDEIGHFRRLVRWLPHWLPRGWHEQAILRQLVTELASSTENRQNLQPIALVLQTAFKRRSRLDRKELVGLTQPVNLTARKLLLSILAPRLPHPLNPGLRRRLLGTKNLSLGQIYETLAVASRLTPMGGHRYWRKMVLLSNLATPSIPNLDQGRIKGACLEREGALRIRSWDRRRPEEIAFLERLISYQANELVEVYRLAKEVSRQTQRVVLTLHNASLGAATGWGTPSFAQQVPEKVAADFADRVNFMRKDFEEKLSSQCKSSKLQSSVSVKEQADNLLRLWGKRLVRPRLLKDLWALRVSLLLNGLPFEKWEHLFIQTRELLADDDYQRLTQGKNFAITFSSLPVAHQRLRTTLSWYLEKKANHSSFLNLLWGLISTGKEWLRTGRLPYFVLPIIDKFFVSSLRDRDLDYLPRFVELVSHMGHEHLYLLIDDTSRAAHPSLQLAMKHWQKRSGFAGLGVFADQGELAAPPLETILASSSQVRLFALRPLSQVHNPVSFNTLLDQRPCNFLSPSQYDSSWKDNLPFLYHGTLVSPLAGTVNQTEEFSPVLTTSAGPMAFGTYYRCRLRHLALERLGFPSREEIVDHSDTRSLNLLWREYGALANLL